MTNKGLRIFFSSLVIIAVLSGCSLSGIISSGDSRNAAEKGGTDKPYKQVAIEYFSGIYDESAVEGINKYIIEPFEQKFPTIKIKWYRTAEWNMVLKAQMAASKGPDLIELEGPTSVVEHTGYNHLYDMTPYIEKYGWDKVIFPWALDSCKVNGRLMALPICYEALVLWYNEDLMKENKWEIPRTYSDLEKIAEECMKKGLIPFAFGTYDNKGANEWWLSMVLNAYAGKENLKSLLNGRLKWTDPNIRGAVEILVEMWQKGWINDKKSQLTSNDDASVLFLKEKAVFKMEGTWMYGQLVGNKPDFSYNFTTFPAMNDGIKESIPMGIGSTLSINANTRYTGEIAEFLNFYINNQQNHAQAIEEYGVQSMPVKYDPMSLSKNIDPVQKNMLSFLDDSNNSNDFGYCLWTYWPPETRQYLIDNIENVYLGRLSVDDYLADAQKIFDKEYIEKRIPAIP